VTVWDVCGLNSTSRSSSKGPGQVAVGTEESNVTYIWLQGIAIGMCMVIGLTSSNYRMAKARVMLGARANFSHMYGSRGKLHV
jgi:hypothetical protein